MGRHFNVTPATRRRHGADRWIDGWAGELAGKAYPIYSSAVASTLWICPSSLTAARLSTYSPRSFRSSGAAASITRFWRLSCSLGKQQLSHL